MPAPGGCAKDEHGRETLHSRHSGFPEREVHSYEKVCYLDLIKKDVVLMKSIAMNTYWKTP
jgi:hypothetical protein